METMTMWKIPFSAIKRKQKHRLKLGLIFPNYFIDTNTVQFLLIFNTYNHFSS